MTNEGKVISRTFEEMFENPVRYEIPFFQRAYAWDRPNWKQLDDDIREQILKDVLEKIEDNNQEFNTDNLQEYLLEYEHFFGAIVILEKNSLDPSLKRFYVIDGQQRITTVYLLIAIIVEVLKRKELSDSAKKYVNYLDSLLKNKDTAYSKDDYNKLKVFSNKGDRLPTYLMLYGKNPSSNLLATDQQLYIPDNNKVDIFRRYMRKKLQKQSVTYLWAYSQAVLKSLKIVWIPLREGKDDPQAIFESLNAKGTPLSASELLCSYIFKPLINEETSSHEKIHNEKWLKSISELGGEKKFEEYLRNLLSIGEKKKIGIGRRMYVFFKNKYSSLKQKNQDSIDLATKILEKIKDSTLLYKNIIDPNDHRYPNDEIKKLLVKINETKMSSSTPFLLSVLQAIKKEEFSEEQAINLLKETLNLLVRRKITKLSVTKYDTFFPGLWNRIKNEPNKIRAFQDEIQKDGLWVSDQDFKDAFKTNPIYNSRELSFSRLILQEIDKTMQSHGQLPDYTSINTVEHIMPQTLNNEWEEYLGEEANDLSLTGVKNTIGNLCLLSRSANSSEGQKLFEEKIKQSALSDVSALNRDLKNRNGKWDIAAIKERSIYLSEKALEVWKWSEI